MKPNLENIMENVISYDSFDTFNEVQLRERIKGYMPEYTIETWNLDDYGTSDIFGSILRRLKSSDGSIMMEDVQFVEEWCTESCDAYFCILAYKPVNKGE